MNARMRQTCYPPQHVYMLAPNERLPEAASLCRHGMP